MTILLHKMEGKRDLYIFLVGTIAGGVLRIFMQYHNRIAFWSEILGLQQNGIKY